MKKRFFLFIAVVFLTTAVYSQGITTASAYFKQISEYYGSLKDYEADFEIKIEKQETAGKLSYKAPDLLRMDYSTPEEQVICFNGDTLTIYLADKTAVLQQVITQDNGNGVSLTTPQGLTLLSRYYSVAYETGQAAEALDKDSDEMVIKFILTKKSNTEAFKYIKIAVNESTKLIRRIEAVTPKGETFLFNFYDYKVNQNIPDARFIYDPPSSANNYNNFLFSE